MKMNILILININYNKKKYKYKYMNKDIIILILFLIILFISNKKYEKIANDVAELMMNNEKIKQLRNKLLKSETIQSWNQTGEYWLQNM